MTDEEMIENAIRFIQSGEEDLRKVTARMSVDSDIVTPEDVAGKYLGSYAQNLP